MSVNKFFEALGKPFPYSDVSWRLQYVDKEKCEGFAVPYLDARAIADRLDEVVGQNNWQDKYIPWHTYMEKTEEQGRTTTKQVQSQICILSIFDEERKEWIEKSDGAENTDFESIKGGISDAFKRAAVKWNVGRYMYRMKPVWVKAKKQGRNYVVNDSDEGVQKKLETEYNKIVAEVTGVQGNTGGDKKVTAQQQNNSNGQTATTQNGQNATPQNGQNTVPQSNIYVIKDVRTQGEGEKAQSKFIVSKDGNNGTFFMQGVDPNIKVGTKLHNIKCRKGQNAYGEYFVLDEYDIAA